ncbi:sensor histidine kinase [Niabella drilacis]|uniref:Histidine kinase n=1 Tax=Niabella drilacis (strain DSM 25811 / CCM 8410 / CCUG 62505 / LMG 26954 / E90) TaxID=1285928 RepID=A0A1G6V5E6_NIADE|nr:histidine kinase [Niabella drilacis]SDD48910.1 Histidine kinase [Niabella drilacis]
MNFKQALSLKENFQAFLTSDISREKVKDGDAVHDFSLQTGNLGVLSFSSDNDDIIEYRFSTDENWKSTRNASGSLFEKKAYILLDQTDVPPGATKTLLLRYKGLPGSVHKINIKGIDASAHNSWTRIGAGFLLALGFFYIFYLLKRRQHKKQLLRLRQKNKDVETQLSLLSGQLNPHFLFNSLNAIQGTLNSENPERANIYIGHVAGFMRDVMDYGKKEFISLEEELRLEEAYLQLEQERKPFFYHINIVGPVDATQTDFPPLLLQPVLENSIRHAFAASAVAAALSVEVSVVNKNLMVQITDNGSEWQPDAVREGHGLSLVKKRIAVYNEKLSTMNISMSTIYKSGTGTITTFTFNNWLV